MYDDLVSTAKLHLMGNQYEVRGLVPKLVHCLCMSAEILLAIPMQI